MINPDTVTDYRSLFQQINDSHEQKIFAVFRKEHDIKRELPSLIQQTMQKEHRDLGLITDEPTFFPHLSMIDNLFVCSSIKLGERKAVLREWASTFDFSMADFSQPFEAFSALDRVKLQLLQLVLSGKAKIICALDFSTLSVFEKQRLLPLLKELTAKASITLWLITADQRIVESPYVDVTLY